MKLLLKKFISCTLATALTVASLSISLVTTVSASDNMWRSSEATVPSVFGMDGSFTGITKSYSIRKDAKSNFSDNFVSDTGNVAGLEGKDIYTIESDRVLDNKGMELASKYFVMLPKVTGTLSIYAINSGSDSTKTDSIRLYDKLTNNGNGVYTIKNLKDYTAYDVHGYNEAITFDPINIEVTANKPIVIYVNNSKTVLLGMKIAERAKSTAYYTLSGSVKVNGALRGGVTVKLQDSSYVTKETVITDKMGNFKFKKIGNTETVNVVVDGTADYFGGSINNITLASDLSGQVIDLEKKVIAPKIDDKASLNVNDLSIGDLINDKVIGTYFTVNTDASPLTVEESNEKIDNVVYTKKIKTNGTGSANKRAIKFTTTGPASVKVVATTGSTKDKTRKCIISDGVRDLASVTCKVDVRTDKSVATPTVLEYNIEKAGTYYIYSSDNIGIYSIDVTINK